jgi:uncharacterized protein
MGTKSFQQAAGFLRINDAKNLLDNSAVHPESYDVVKQMAADLNCSVADLMKNNELRKQIDIKKYISETIGIYTLQDILNELEKPARDPRSELQHFEYAQGINTLEDLYVGLVLPGIVTNITNFGAFVDIGVKQDGLVHISQITNKFIKDPNDVLKLSQQVTVKITEIDIPRKRVQLSMTDV